MKLNLLVSLGSHLSILVLTLFLSAQQTGQGNGKHKSQGRAPSGEKAQGGQSGQESKGDIIPPPLKDVTVQIFEKKDITQKQKKKKRKQSKFKTSKDCPESFGGIGIHHNSVDLSVIQVVEGYPAFEAGIELGDIILSPVDSIRGTVGTEVTVLVQKKDGRVVSYTMIRDKICTAGAPKKDVAP